MKRSISLSGLAVLFGLVIAVAFLGCSGKRLTGVYEAPEYNLTLEFKFGSKVIVTASGFSREMKYSITNDTLTIDAPQGLYALYTIKDKNTLVSSVGGNVVLRKKTR